MKTILRTSAIALAVLAMTGCAQYIRVASKVQNFGYELHESSINNHLFAEVSRDEVYLGSLLLPQRTQYMVGGADADNGSYRYRIAETHMTLTDPKNFLVPYGSKFAFRPAVVADQFPLLKKGDIVELRNVGTYDVLNELASKGEGNAIVRVFCKMGDANYQECRDRLPKIGVSPRPAGITGSQFKPSLKDYAPLTFTQWYDESGKALRPFPVAMPQGYGMSADIPTVNLAPVEDRVIRR